MVCTALVVQNSYFWKMLFLTIWALSLISFINSCLKKYNKDIQWAFFFAFLGVVFTKSPDFFKNQELMRLVKFLGFLLFLGSHIYIQVVSKTNKFNSILLWIQKFTLLAVFVTWYFKLPGSQPAVLLNLVLIPWIFLKFKSLKEPLKWSVINTITAILIELAIRVL